MMVYVKSKAENVPLYNHIANHELTSEVTFLVQIELDIGLTGFKQMFECRTRWFQQQCKLNVFSVSQVHNCLRGYCTPGPYF